MLATARGKAPPEKREGRARLSVRDPLVETVLAGLDLREESLQDRLVADVRRWLARGGFANPDRHIGKVDAHRLLKVEMAKLAGGAR